MKEYDLAIIGAGPGGYPAALFAAVKGLKVALIERNKIGGICLNAGCIPTKFFLRASQLWQDIKEANNWGIGSELIGLNYAFLKNKKESLVASLRAGISFLLQRKGVDLFIAQGKIISSQEILLKNKKEEQKIIAKNIIIATGSSPLELKGLDFDHEKILSSDSILNLECIPQNLLVVGGGVIGVEFAVHFARLGTNVYIVELLDSILPQQEKEISKTLEITLKKLGIKIFTSTRVARFTSGEILKVELENGEEIQVEKILIAVSRKANIQNVWENVKIETKEGFIEVNEYLRTNLSNIYAIGDVKGGFMLAHTASYEAKVALENILDKKKIAEYSAIPACIYTEPEIATVGLKEEDAREKGYEVKVAKFPFSASGKARAISKAEGFIKLIADARSRVILGAHLIGPLVSELIPELTLAIKFKIPYTELDDVVHPHPTISEAVKEAIEILNATPIHTL